MIELAELQNVMALEDARFLELLEIMMFDNNKVKHKGKLETYHENQLRLEKHCGQTFFMILG